MFTNASKRRRLYWLATKTEAMKRKPPVTQHSVHKSRRRGLGFASTIKNIPQQAFRAGYIVSSKFDRGFLDQMVALYAGDDVTTWEIETDRVIGDVTIYLSFKPSVVNREQIASIVREQILKQKPAGITLFVKVNP